MLFSILLPVKGYQWLKERVNSEEGRRQLAKIKELHLLADRLGCTAAQLAIGERPNNMIVQNARTEKLFYICILFHIWNVFVDLPESQNYCYVSGKKFFDF